MTRVTGIGCAVADNRSCTQGLRALLSAPWYLNLGEYTAENWLPYYLVEPLDFNVRLGHICILLPNSPCTAVHAQDFGCICSRWWGCCRHSVSSC